MTNKVFAFGLDVLSSTLDAATNVVSFVLGDSTSGSVDSSNVESMQHSGFASLPAPPSTNAPSCQTVAIRMGDRNVVVAEKDIRACDRYAQLVAGECMIYGTVGQARVKCGADGAVTLYTTDSNEAGGNAVFFRIHPTDGLLFFAPWGWFKFNPTGLHVKHASFRLDAGGMGGLPGPLSVLGGYFTLQAPSVTLKGSVVKLGPGPLYNPVTYGLAENPVTTPGVPIIALGFGAPIGIVSSAAVRVSI